MTSLQLHIIQAVAYFDIFHYPVTNEEINNFLGTVATQQGIDSELSFLTANQFIFKLNNFYSLQNNLSLAERRINGNEKAKAEMKKAAKAARLLFKFPFVEGLALSGSLSKDFADEKTDIDFFIIAKTNRLWIARTAMHIFYKFVKLLGKQRMFCMNYYIDETGMEIQEKNIFTAVEIVTLVPMQGLDCVNNFISTNNKWVKNYLPHYKTKQPPTQQIKKITVRKLIEKIFGGRLGDATDNWLMKLTASRWQKKESRINLNEKGICMGMLAGKHFAKPDPKHFQFKILQHYENKLKQVGHLDKQPELIPT